MEQMDSYYSDEDNILSFNEAHDSFYASHDLDRGEYANNKLESESESVNTRNGNNTCQIPVSSEAKTTLDPTKTSEASKADNHSHLFVFNGHKAGVGNSVNAAQVVYEMSKDSVYFKRAADLDEKAKKRVAIMQQKLSAMSKEQIDSCKRESSKQLANLEYKRNISRICVVLDMDMFFAAVEIRDQPHLADKPVAVGGSAMICTANYVARKYGVRSAMPGYIAKKLCPELIFVWSDMSKYGEVSKQVKEIIKEYDPNYRSWSLDEVYFDLTDYCASKWDQRFNSSQNPYHREAEEEEGEDEEISNLNDRFNELKLSQLRQIADEAVNEIRTKVKVVTRGLTSSAGIANNHTLAKICADINKPDGQFQLTPTRDAIIEFVSNLPTRKIPGIGKVAEKVLSDLGISTMGDVRQQLYKIFHVMTPVTVSFMLRSCVGISEEEATNAAENKSEKKTDSVIALNRKSLGAERTFKAISRYADFLVKIREMSQLVSAQLVEEGIGGRLVTLKLKSVAFELHTRCHRSPNLIQSAADIEACAKQLLQEMYPMTIRLLGIALSKLEKVGTTQYYLKKHGFIPSSTAESSPVTPSSYPSTILQSQRQEVECPICSKVCSDLITLNLHLDRNCKEEESTQLPTNKKAKANHPSPKKASNTLLTYFKQS